MLKSVRNAAACLAALGNVLVQPALAQQVVAPGQLVLGGMPMVCGNIPTVIQPIPDTAMARPGVILLNPSMFQLPPTLQQFIYAHECAHHLLGSNEAAADCWAIRTGRDQGWFPPQAFPLLIQAFQYSAGDWTHAPGPQRIQNLAACGNS